MKRILTSLLMISIGGCAEVYGQLILPEKHYTTDVNTLIAVSRTAIQGSSQVWYEHFVSGNSPFDLTGANAVWMRYGLPESGLTITGTIVSATSGVVRLKLTPSNTSSNGFFNFDIRVGDGNDVLCQTYGDLTIQPLAGGSSSPWPTGTVVDCTGVTYINPPWAYSIVDQVARDTATYASNSFSTNVFLYLKQEGNRYYPIIK